MKSYLYAVILFAGFSTFVYMPRAYTQALFALGAFSCFWALMLMPMLIEDKEED